MESGLFLTNAHLAEMIGHVDSHAPLEACGLLAGRNSRVEAVIPIANAEKSPTRFRMDPLEQLRAFEWMDEHGLDLLGIFHSHPTGPEAASPTDIAEASYPVIHVVLSRRNRTWRARGFRIENGQALEVSFQVE